VRNLSLLILLCLSTPAQSGFALGQVQYVETDYKPGSFPVVRNGGAADLFVDVGDFSGVVRAANDLQADISRVTGRTPRIIHGGDNPGANVIIVGAVGKNEMIGRLARDGKIDTSTLAGKWESFFIQVVPRPLPGIENALVVCGSDKRGTIYGIYDLSEEIGVSPWHFWADVPARHRDELFVKAGRFAQGPPSVKYRGIFLNDEAPDLTGWANEKFGGYNHAFYTNVFELLLRLKANYLWPAMWNNCFDQDDPLNAKLADDFGIVMGTSHVEPMMRADKEWNRAGHTARQWNFLTHSNELAAFWREGLERGKSCENIVTIGMRGKIDTPMSETANIALLEEIVATQRTTIEDVYHTNAAAVPQLWALYKEVQEYYEKGMRVPDDVTLLWCDDNWGNIRRLPTPDERRRGGGAGIYYHFDYVGDPRNYKWIGTVQIPRVWEQMNLAWQYGADRIWIANVGHLQHVVLPTEFFLTLAWDPARWPADRISEFTRLWAQREFGPEFAPQISDIVSKTAKFNARRKPELLEPGTFSLTNYQEADTVLADWKAVVSKADEISAKLPVEERDAFFELVLYPAKASEMVNELYIAAAKNRLYAGEARASANDFAADVKRLFQADASLSDYYNHNLAGGKWNHMMDQTHIGYTYWQQPESNSMPRIVETAVPSKGNSGGAIADPTKSDPRMPSSPFGSGFVESGGCVSMEAEHFTRKVDSPSARWERIPDLGRTLSAMTVFPVTAPSAAPPDDSPRLEYNMYLFEAGRVKIEAILSPTLNFVPGRGLRFALSFDDAPPRIVTAVPAGYSAGGGNRDWEKTVAESVRKVDAEFDLKDPGEHTLKFWMVDPGVVLQKIVVDCGGVKPSYLGPPESFRR
jgi:hypothetical protein